MSKRFQKFQNESGQAAVYVALLSAVVLFFVAATTNISKLVTEKMAMQDAVDLAVFSGAATQAGYFNKMREINEQSWQVINDGRQNYSISQAPGDPEFFCGSCIPVGQCDPEDPNGMDATEGTADILLNEVWQPMVDMNNNNISQLNTQANQAAIQAATKTADDNYKGTGNDFKAYSVSASQPLVQLKNSQDKIQMSYFGWCQPEIGGPVRATFKWINKIHSWEFKQDQGQAVFAGGIVGAAPASPWVDIGNGQYFGNGGCMFGTPSGGRCSLDVYAAAEPFYGKLGSNLQTPHAQWEQQFGALGTDPAYDEQDPLILDQTDRLAPDQVVNGTQGKYMDYGTRFLGVFETNQVSGHGAMNTVLGSQYQQYMRH